MALGMNLKNLSSNWKKLQETLKTNESTKPSKSATQLPATNSSTSGQNGAVKRRRVSTSSSSVTNKNDNKRTIDKTESKFERGTIKRCKMTADVADEVESKLSLGSNDAAIKQASSNDRINEGLSPTAEIGKYIAIDCEMVGVGPDPDNDSALARVSIVNYNGEQVYDSFVRPKELVTDWRTHISGVSPKHMAIARSLEEVQRDVAKVLDGRILVGHAVRNDLDALLLSHPRRDIRDTSRHPPYRKLAGGGSPRLKVLAAELLGIEIQGSSHSSLEDARAAMMLFRRDKEAFEREHAKKYPVRVKANGEKDRNSSKSKKKKSTKKKKR
ncbi:hypothetical protein VTO42DRAFT_8827 [Malbranchea cinnamomea]